MPSGVSGGRRRVSVGRRCVSGGLCCTVGGGRQPAIVIGVISDRLDFWHGDFLVYVVVDHSEL